MMRLALIVATLLSLSPLVQAQTVPNDFELASIHMVQEHANSDAYISPYGTNKFTARNVTLEFLIGIAFGIDSNHIFDKEEWMDSQLYEVIAEVDPAIKLTREQTQPLLQHLLESRFHLKTHTEDIQLAGYAMVVAKGAPKLTTSSKTSPHAQFQATGLQASGVTLKFFAAFLERPTGRPVVDETGIVGNFDVNLSYAPGNATDSPLPSIFTALQDQLGLKLQPKKIPFRKLIVDHAERTPLEN